MSDPSTGLDVLREIFRSAPFVASLGLELESLSPGQCGTCLRVRPEHLQQTGAVHAGVLMTIADHTAGGAAGSVLDSSSYPLTVDLSISLLRAASGDRLTCRAHVLKAGRSLIFAESEVFAGDGETAILVAKARVTLAVLSKDRKETGTA